MRSALLTASLAGVLALSGLTQAAAAPSTDRTSAAQYRSTLLGQIAVRGQVTDSANRGVTGAKIELYAWPGAWPGKQPVHHGERVPLRLIGQSFSTAGGRYAVRINHPAALKVSALRDGTVNLQVVVAGSKTWYEFPLRIISTSIGPALAGIWASPGKRSTPMTVALRVQGSTWKEAARRDFCDHEVSVYDKDYAKAWGNVDQTYERYSGISATSKLTNGQNTTFSVGISGSGDAGTFSTSGHFSLGDTVTTQFKTFAGPAIQSYQANYTPSEYTHYLNPGHCFVNDYAQWSTNDVIKYINTSGRNFHACGQFGDPASGSPGRVVAGLPNGGGR